MIFFQILAASGKLGGVINSPSIPTPNQVGDVLMTFDGNSLTASSGVAISQYYPYRLGDYIESDFNSLKLYSYGAGGQTLTDMQADAATQIYTTPQAGKINILICWEDVNQIYEGENGLNHFNNMKTYVQGAKDAGFNKVVLITSYYFKKDADGIFRNNSGTDVSHVENVGGVSDRLEDYFNLVRDTPLTDVPWDATVDLRNAPNIGGARNEIKDNNYFGDFIHLTSLGYSTVEIEVLRTIKSMLGIPPTSYAPSALVAANIVNTSLNLSWQSPSTTYPVSEYRIYKDNRLFGTTNNLTISLTGLTQGTNYLFNIAAVDVNVNEHKSDILLAKTSGISVLAPINLTFSSITSSSFIINFNGLIGANYKHYYEVSLQSDFSIIAWSHNAVGTSVMVTGRGPSTLHYVRVQTKVNDGTIADSEWLVDEVTTTQ